MALLYIPLRQNVEQRATQQELELDGVRFRIRSRYSARTDRWYIDLKDLSDNILVGSIATVPGVDLLIPYRHLAIPQGSMYVSDPQNRLPGNIDSQDVTSLLVYREVV